MIGTRGGRALALLGVAVLAAVVAVGATGTPAAAQAAQAAQVRFVESAMQALEGRGLVQVVVERVDLPVSRLLVHYRTQDGTSSAVAGSDYVHTAGTLVFEVGVRSSSFVVSLRDDEVAEGIEHLLLHLETTSGSGASTRLTILDDDEPMSSSPSSSSSASTGEAGAAAAAVTAGPGRPGPAGGAGATLPVVVAASAGTTRAVAAPRVRSRVAAARPVPPRRIILQQTPSTPFELRPAPGSFDGTGFAPTAVDPLWALAAGLLLARVGAEVWFRLRIAAG